MIRPVSPPCLRRVLHREPPPPAATPAVSAGEQHSIALHADGTLRTWATTPPAPSAPAARSAVSCRSEVPAPGERERKSPRVRRIPWRSRATVASGLGVQRRGPAGRRLAHRALGAYARRWHDNVAAIAAGRVHTVARKFRRDGCDLGRQLLRPSRRGCPRVYPRNARTRSRPVQRDGDSRRGQYTMALHRRRARLGVGKLNDDTASWEMARSRNQAAGKRRALSWDSTTSSRSRPAPSTRWRCAATARSGRGQQQRGPASATGRGSRAERPRGCRD
jgi:hypothetical protein